MKGARYLLRFDDICPTMDWIIWEQVEELLLDLRIKPILAVVPDNRDPKLVVTTEREDFWERVRYWQSLGWTIGLHGYQHRYETTAVGIVGINSYSEFAGLSHDDQKNKIKAALDIFSQRGVIANVWVAPAHSFDEITVKLLVEFGVHVISDGYYWRVIQKSNAIWFPQQMWRFRYVPFGLWTVCYHPNRFGSDDLKKLKVDLKKFRRKIVSLSEILDEGPHPIENQMDRIFHRVWAKAIYYKRRLQ